MNIKICKYLKKQIYWLKSIKKPILSIFINKYIKYIYKYKSLEYKIACESKIICKLKIKELKKKLKIFYKKLNNRLNNINNIVDIKLSSRIDLIDMFKKHKSSYYMVDEEKINFSRNNISINSPIANIIIGKRVGDIIILNTYLGKRYYKIL